MVRAVAEEVGARAEWSREEVLLDPEFDLVAAAETDGEKRSGCVGGQLTDDTSCDGVARMKGAVGRVKLDRKRGAASRPPARHGVGIVSSSPLVMNNRDGVVEISRPRETVKMLKQVKLRSLQRAIMATGYPRD